MQDAMPMFSHNLEMGGSYIILIIIIYLVSNVNNGNVSKCVSLLIVIVAVYLCRYLCQRYPGDRQDKASECPCSL